MSISETIMNGVVSLALTSTRLFTLIQIRCIVILVDGDILTPDKTHPNVVAISDWLVRCPPVRRSELFSCSP